MRKSLVTHLTFVRSLAGMRSQVHDQVFPYAERLAAHLANVRLLSRMYTHVNLQVRLAAHRLPAHLARDLILAGVYLKVHLQRGLPVALEIADIALVLLPLAVGSHVHVKIRRARIRGVTHLTHERLLARVREQVSLQRLIRVEALVANLAMYHVLLIVLLLVQTQIVSGDLRHAAYVAGETFVVLLQVGLQEFLGLETLAAQNALKRSLLLMRLYHMLLQFLLIVENFIALLAAIFGLRIPLVILSMLQKLQLLEHLLPTNFTLVNRRTLATRIVFGNPFYDTYLRRRF